MLSAKWQQFCLGINVLIKYQLTEMVFITKNHVCYNMPGSPTMQLSYPPPHLFFFFAADISKCISKWRCIFLNESFCILIKIFWI